MAFDGEYKVITGFNPNLKHNNQDWTPLSPQIHGVAPLVFDLANDPGENKDLYATKSSRGEQLLRTLEANTAANTASSTERG